MNHRTVHGTAAILISTCSFGVAAQAPVPREADVREELVTQITAPRKLLSVLTSPGNEQAALVVSEGKAQFVVHDSADGPRFDEVDNVLLAPDGKRLAYVGRKGDVRHVVVGPTVSKGYRAVRNLAFTPDGGRVTYGFTGDPISGRECPCEIGVAVDATAHPASEAIFSRDGARFVLLGAQNDDLAAVAVAADGTRRPLARPSYTASFSPDGSRLASLQLFADNAAKGDVAKYLAELVVKGRAYSPQVQFKLVVDDTVSEGPAAHPRVPPTFSHRGDHLAYVGILPDRKMTLVLDGKPIGETASQIDRITFSPNDLRIAYRAGGENVVLCDVIARTCVKDKVACGSTIVFSDNSERIAFTCGFRSLAWMRVDNQDHSGRWKDFNWVGKPVFSPDNRVVTYFASSGNNSFITLDAAKVKANNDDLTYSITPGFPSFTPSGSITFFGVRESKQEGARVYRVTVTPKR